MTYCRPDKYSGGRDANSCFLFVNETKYPTLDCLEPLCGENDPACEA